MNQKTTIALFTVIILILGGALWYFMTDNSENTNSMQQQTNTQTAELSVDDQTDTETMVSGPVEESGGEESADTVQQAADGRYADYSADLVDDLGYEQTVLFFHAEWCPECRAFDQDIRSNQVPAGVQILKVDYDTATNLREQYGVTIQTSFVSVNSDGAQLSKWVGYGQERTLDALLQNI